MKILKWLDRLEKYVIGTLFISAVTVSLIEVFCRYFLNKPQSWTTEFLEYLMVGAIFIGFGRALKENHHIVVDIVYDKLPYMVKRVISVLSNLIGAGYCLLLTVNGITQVSIAKANDTVTVTVGIPIWIPYLVMPIGMGLLCIYFLVKAYKSIMGDEKEIIGEITIEGIEQDDQPIKDKEVSV